MKGEGSVKVPCPFVHAGTAREPLFTRTFTISGEGEGYFLKTCFQNFKDRFLLSPSEESHLYCT